MILFKIIISPLALIYWLLSTSRNLLFKWGLLRQYKSRIPVISVGNLCMGGSGKTPHVALILEHLTDYNKAVISRGYGRKNKVLIEANSEINSTKDTGDEPMELLQKFEGSSFKIIIDGNRKNALRHLEMHKEKTDIVVLDDGFQHQYVKRDLNILLTDFSNPFYKDLVLPLGKLREHRKGGKNSELITLDTEDLPVFKAIDDIVKNAQKIAEIRLLREQPNIANVILHQQNANALMKQGDVEGAVGISNKVQATEKILNMRK